MMLKPIAVKNWPVSFKQGLACTGSLCIWSARFASSTHAQTYIQVLAQLRVKWLQRVTSDIMTKLSKVAYKTILLSSIMLENNRKSQNGQNGLKIGFLNVKTFLTLIS